LTVVIGKINGGQRGRDSASSFVISVISQGLSVLLLSLFNQPYKIHLDALAIQERKSFLQFKELLNEF